MKIIKKFESFLVSDSEANNILDKINTNGIDNISDIEKNKLNLYSTNDAKVIDIINKMADITLKFMDVNNKIKKVKDDYIKSKNIFQNEWIPLNTEISKYEKELESFGIELGSPELNNLFKKTRPDAYGDYKDIYESKKDII